MAALASGCASVAVSNDAIEQNTASSLGHEKGTFTISDRVDNGVKSSYVVETASGATYSCYVTGAVSVTGPVVSDAMCSERGQSAQKTAEGACNDLLKAAGKC